MEYTTSHRGNSTNLPSIATQQANRIKQLEAQAARQSIALSKADAVIAAARRSAFSDPNGDLAKALQAYDAWLKELEQGRATG